MEEAVGGEGPPAALPLTPRPVNQHRRERAGENDSFSSIREVLDAVVDENSPYPRSITFNHEMGRVIFVPANPDRTDTYRRLRVANPYGSDARLRSPFSKGRTPVKVQIYVLRPIEGGDYEIEPQSFVSNSVDGPILRRRKGQPPLIITELPHGLVEWRIGTTRYHSTNGDFHLRIMEILRGPGEGFFAVEYAGVKPPLSEELKDWYAQVEAWEERKNNHQNDDQDDDGNAGGVGAVPVA